MPEDQETFQPIVTTDLRLSAQEVIQHTLEVTDHPSVLTGKLGTADTPPLSDPQVAANITATARDISDQFALIRAMLRQADNILDEPLANIARRTNLAIAASGIINRTGRRRAYSEDTLQTLIRLGFCDSQHLAIIRAAGYAYPPPENQLDINLHAFILDVADYMTRTPAPLTIEQILQAIPPWDEIIHGHPNLDIEHCINQHARVLPDSNGRYSSDHPWRRFVPGERLVHNTAVRVLRREGQPLALSHLTNEVNTVLRRDRTSNRIGQHQIQEAIIGSDLLAWNGPASCRLAEWPETPHPAIQPPTPRTVSQRIHQYLSQHGPMTSHEIRETFGRNIPNGNVATGRTADDLHRRFIRLHDRRVAALPFSVSKNHPRQPIDVIADPEPDLGPANSTIFVSELHWLNQYTPHLAGAAELGLLRVAITGSRAAGAASTRVPLEITIVIVEDPHPLLQQLITQASELSSQEIRSVRPSFNTISLQKWIDTYQGDTQKPHHDLWLP